MVAQPREGIPQQGRSLFTATEQMVLELLATGLTNPEIAGELHLTTHNVEKIIFNISSTLGLSHIKRNTIKRVRLATWWASRYSIHWCSDCPLNPLVWQVERVSPPRQQSAAHQYRWDRNPGRALAAMLPIAYRGQCAAPDCDLPVIGPPRKRWCSNRCYHRIWNRVHYQKRDPTYVPPKDAPFRGQCLAPDCDRPVFGPPNKKWCRIQCKHRTISRQRRAKKGGTPFN